MNKFIWIRIFYCCHFPPFHMKVFFISTFFHWPRQTTLEHKAPALNFHPQLVLSRIVSERRSGIRKSFWRWFKPIYKDNRWLSPNQFWLFGNRHPELNKHVKNNDHVCPLYLSEGMSLGVTRSCSIFNLQGVVLPPKQSPLGAPLVVGCSWHPPLGCQIAFFCGKCTER